MQLNNKEAELFIPDGTPVIEALARTTDLCIAAHHDDIEIMAYGPISACYGQKDRWFTGVTVSDGAGSPRSGIYADYTDEDMKAVRAVEQKQAAHIGRYAAQFLLCYKSSEIKDPDNKLLIEEIKTIIRRCRPKVIYTHNLADKHDTHVATALRVIRAIRELTPDERPEKLYALEVWRGLDWVNDEEKLTFDTSGHPNLAAALLGIYDSQIAGGKRYDLAALGRRSANATFFASHDVDSSDSLTYGIDMSPLIRDTSLSVTDFITGFVDRFKNEVITRLERF
ncbi:MAG: PIG-L family deacetylase [Clostridiales bacterium]|nr:PIG-L family deacetylase [Clostridiales bacterium]